MKKRILSVALVLAMALAVLPASALAAPSFSDVPGTHWAYGYVEYCAAAGIMNGVGDGRFDPGGTLSQAMFVTILGRTAFRDWASAAAAPGDDWYDSYVRAAETHGLLNGSYVGYDLNDRITRYDMAQLIRNTCITVFGSDDPRGTSVDQDFRDFAIIPERYLDAVVFCYEYGIINGYDNGTFSGSDAMTRDQAATVFYRLIDRLGDRVGFTVPGTSTQPPDEADTALGEAVEQYRRIIDMAGKYVYADYVEPSGKYNYALVQMQPNDPVPTLLLKMVGTGELMGYVDYIRVFRYDPDTKTVIQPAESLMEGVAAAGGYRGMLDMAGDGNGLLNTEWSSGTGAAFITRVTFSGDSLVQSIVWEGRIDLIPTSITFADINWYDSGDLSGLNSWAGA